MGKLATLSSVVIIDGQSGYELKFEGEKGFFRYLRVGYDCDGSWRTFSLRKDFLPAKKLQREDDISVSATLKLIGNMDFTRN